MKRFFYLIDNDIACEQEKRRSAFCHLTTNLIDKIVVDAIVGEVSSHRPHGGAACQPQEGNKKEQTKQHAPKGAAQRTGPCQICRLSCLRLLLALRPLDNGSILNFDQLLGLQLLQLCERLCRSCRAVVLP